MGEKLNQTKDRYHKLRGNVVKKKPGRKPKVIDLTTSTTASDNDYVEEVKPVTENISKKIGRRSKLNFDSGDSDVVEVE